MKVTTWIGAMLIVLVHVGCGGDASPGHEREDDAGSDTPVDLGGKLAGSCNNMSGGFCNEFTGIGYDAKSVEENCNKLKAGSFLAGACPTENLVGTCLMYKGQSTESYYRYYANFPGTPSVTAADAAMYAKDQCKDIKGEWRAP